jgi:carbon-monoxide dehydrogenase medium subunit
VKLTADGWIASSMRSLPAMRVYEPITIDEALAVLERDERAPVIVAGGTDLVAQFNEGLAPGDLLAIRGISALRGIAVADGHLGIGSCVTHEAGSCSDIVREAVPGLAAAWGRIANVRVRMTATIGGNVMARRPRYEMPILLDALGASLNFSGKLLVQVAIPLEGLIAFDYDRSLRPIMTQATCIRRNGDGALSLRTTVGTEATAPFGFDMPLDVRDTAQLTGVSRSISAAAFAAFPADFADPYTSNAYIRRAGRAILERQLERLTHAPS